MAEELNEIWMSDTARTYRASRDAIQILLKKTIAESLGIKPGMLVEIRVRNTGLMAPVDKRSHAKKETEAEKFVV